MTQYNHLPIFQLGYKLTLEIYKTTQRFPREYKYSLGQRLKEISAEFLDYVVIANSLEDKMPAIKNAELRIERLKIHVRLAYDLKIISLGKYEEVFRSLEDLGRQLSGWKEWAGKSGGGGGNYSMDCCNAIVRSTFYLPLRVWRSETRQSRDYASNA